MKLKRLLAATAMGLTLWSPSIAPRGSSAVMSLGTPAAAADFNDRAFVGALAPYGDWLDVGEYGHLWRPAVPYAGWQPYTDGHWAFTDEYGWYWVANEPWGWAPYHYGRWVLDARFGWLWVPGTVWAPAWVSWRTGGGMIGWAPLPPAARWGHDGFAYEPGFHDRDIGWNCWSFVPERSFLAPRITTVVVPPARNVTIINNTVNVTRYTVVNQRIVNRSIAVNTVQQVTGTPVVHYRPTVVASPAATAVPLAGKQLAVYRPPALPAPGPAPAPAPAAPLARTAPTAPAPTPPPATAVVNAPRGAAPGGTAAPAGPPTAVAKASPTVPVSPLAPAVSPAAPVLPIAPPAGATLSRPAVVTAALATARPGAPATPVLHAAAPAPRTPEAAPAHRANTSSCRAGETGCASR